MIALVHNETLLVFIGCFALVVASSVVLSTALDRVGSWLRLSAGLLGIVTAFGADSPEIASSIAALQTGNHDVGLGVIIGSNVFNLAALLGLTAIVAGNIATSFSVVALNGGVGLYVLAIVLLQILQVIPAAMSLGLIALVFVPYVVLAMLSPRQLAGLHFFPPPVRNFLAAALTPGARALELRRANENIVDENSAEESASAGPSVTTRASFELLAFVPALFAIIAGSIGLVNTAVILGDQLHVPQTLTGALLLAGLTGIPNIVAAIRLALNQRGAIVVSEALNSNTINLISGVALPGVLIGLGSPSAFVVFGIWWLFGSSIFVLAIMLFKRHISRGFGVAITFIWTFFALATIAMAVAR